MRYIEEYLHYLKYEKNYSQYTIDSYEEDIREYYDFLEEENIDILKVKYDNIKDYFKVLSDKKNIIISIPTGIITYSLIIYILVKILQIV